VSGHGTGAGPTASGGTTINVKCQGRALGALALMLGLLSAPPASAASRINYVHNDHLGTPQALNESGNVVWQADYEPFGQASETIALVAQPLRFPGQYPDVETGLHYNYFRDYESTIGRYLRSDLIGLNGGTNVYAYAAESPINLTDPLGLLTVAGGIGASYIAGVGGEGGGGVYLNTTDRDVGGLLSGVTELD
jgi:RHS repeat-associated protein